MTNILKKHRKLIFILLSIITILVAGLLFILWLGFSNDFYGVTERTERDISFGDSLKIFDLDETIENIDGYNLYVTGWLDWQYKLSFKVDYANLNKIYGSIKATDGENIYDSTNLYDKEFWNKDSCIDNEMLTAPVEQKIEVSQMSFATFTTCMVEPKVQDAVYQVYFYGGTT